MATPSTAINRFDLSISFGEFSTALNRKGFIGMQVLTPIAVALQTAEFLRLPVEALLTPIEDTRRAPKAGYKRDDFEWDTDSYKTHEHGVEEEIDDRTIAMYGSEIRADRIHAERVVNRLAIAYEQEVAQAVFNATTWSSYTTALTTPWSTKDTADPIADIDAAVEAVSSQCGHEPNALILTEFAFKKMIRTARIEDLLKYSGIDDPKSLSDSQMSELLQVPQIIRAKGYYNSGNLGGDASFTRLWDQTMAMVCHLHDSMDLEDPEPTIGRTIQWSEEAGPIPGADNGPGLIVEEYREENRRGSVLRGRTDYQTKILYAAAGHLLTNVTA